jgi:hypothetical protein
MSDLSSDSSETTTVRERLASTSPVLLIGALVLALVVAGAAGFGIGVKVEQSRKSSSKSKSAAAAAARRQAAARNAATAGSEVIGTVTATDGKTITVKTSKGKTVTLRVPKTVVVRTASKGSASDISKGSRAVFKASSFTKVKELVILPAAGKAGVMLTGVTSGSVSFKGRGGKTVTVDTSGATVDKTAVGKLANVTKDATLIAMTRRLGKATVVTQIIVLPAGSAFA